MFDPWHYLPVHSRKPSELQNGASFKDWVPAAVLDRIRRELAGSVGGDRQMVENLTAVLSDRLPAVETVCAEALREGVHRLTSSSTSSPGSASRPRSSPS